MPVKFTPEQTAFREAIADFAKREVGDNETRMRLTNNGTEPTILTAAALEALKERLKTPPDDGGQWTGPKIARWLAQFHRLKSVHDQRGWDALIAIAVGGVIGTLMIGTAGAIGVQSRVPAMVLMRPSLGRRGSYAATSRASPSGT